MIRMTTGAAGALPVRTERALALAVRASGLPAWTWATARRKLPRNFPLRGPATVRAFRGALSRG